MGYYVAFRELYVVVSVFVCVRLCVCACVFVCGLLGCHERYLFTLEPLWAMISPSLVRGGEEGVKISPRPCTQEGVK